MKCPDCKGSGEIRSAGVTCVRCGGSGTVEPDERDKEIERLRARVERLDVQLAGCGVAAYGGTGEAAIAKRDSYGWSDSYQATLDLRLKYGVASKVIEQLREALRGMCRTYCGQGDNNPMNVVCRLCQVNAALAAGRKPC